MIKNVLKAKNKKCVFIGGKQIGFNCIKQLLKSNIVPELIIPNIDDNGKDTWHESTTKFSLENKLNVLKNKNVKDKEVIEKIKNVNPEIIFSIGGTQIIPNEVLKIPKLGCLNIHPAMLPKYRGRYSTVHAIFNGEKATGVTAHWMDSGVDTGPIISQRKISVDKSDTAKSLYDKFTKAGTELFAEVLKKWIRNKKITSFPQDEKKATYYSKGLPNSGEINWNWNGDQIYNFIRAMTFEPFPPASFKIGNKKMVIVQEKYFKGFGK